MIGVACVGVCAEVMQRHAGGHTALEVTGAAAAALIVLVTAAWARWRRRRRAEVPESYSIRTEA